MFLRSLAQLGQVKAVDVVGSLAYIGLGDSGLNITSLGGQCCPIDFNHDGDVNPDDLGDFITCYFQDGCAAADFNHDGNFDPDDLGDFITAYFMGC